MRCHHRGRRQARVLQNGTEKIVCYSKKNPQEGDFLLFLTCESPFFQSSKRRELQVCQAYSCISSFNELKYAISNPHSYLIRRMVNISILKSEYYSSSLSHERLCKSETIMNKGSFMSITMEEYFQVFVIIRRSEIIAIFCWSSSKSIGIDSILYVFPYVPSILSIDYRDL